MTKGAGARRLYSTISQHFHGISRPQIERYVQSSSSLTKLHPTFQNKAPLKPVRACVPFERHQIDLVDFSSKLETKDGITYRFVLSILDVFSRFLWLRPLCDKTSQSVVKSLVQMYLDQQWGAPKIIQTDQGGEFKGMMNSLCEKLGVRLIHSQAYHPQSQGKDERSHRVWKDCLRYDLQHLDDISWVDSLPDYCRIHNESVNSAIGCSPYRAMFGFHPHHITRLLKAGGKSMDGYTCEDNAEYETVEEHSQVSEGTLNRLKELQDIRREVLIKSDKSSSKMVDKHLKTNPPSQYEVGRLSFVRHLGKDKGVNFRVGRRSPPKAVEGEILQVDNKLHKYKVRIGKKKFHGDLFARLQH
ncbi:uncharacterized protein LOC124274166 [Haliotis rubra]|uniref:uncharacterized protein LOC124274166 n=1 Tax=Haliotis rubra TaxID=36100 RepID=UPI001EE54E2B|nr:uncharacterized protein LOC124274166 [Haliotis rubra]